MTCISCGFENPDSEKHCFRCGRSLDTDEIDVVPDRLKRGRPSNRRQQWWKARFQSQHWFQFRRPPLAYALLSLLPGLGQWAAGRARRGRLAFLIWAACLLVRFVSAPPPIATAEIVYAWLFTPDWLTLSVHTTIMLDAYRVAPNRPGGRLEMLHLCVVAVLSWGILQFAHSALGVAAPSQVVRVVYPNYGDSQVATGDVLSIWRLPRYRALRVQSVVLFRPQYPAMALYDYVELPATVTAVPGDSVALGHGSLLVNGVTIATPAWLVENFRERKFQELSLASEQYLVIPPIPVEIFRSKDLIVGREFIWGVATRIIEPEARRRRLRW